MFATRYRLPSVTGVTLGAALAALSVAAALADPLPSWNEGPTKAAIVAFVERVATEGSSDFVPIQERVAVFDNDGTLWVEQPVPAQVAFDSPASRPSGGCIQIGRRRSRSKRPWKGTPAISRESASAALPRF